MKRLTKLRELFHELPNSINGINVIPFTFAFYLEGLDFDKLDKGSIKKEVSLKLKDIMMYHGRVITYFKSICAIISKHNLPEDAASIIAGINERTAHIGKLLKRTYDLYTKIERGDLKENVSKLAKDLRAYEPESHSLGGKVQALKDKLIALKLYYEETT